MTACTYAGALAQVRTCAFPHTIAHKAHLHTCTHTHTHIAFDVRLPQMKAPQDLAPMPPLGISAPRAPASAAARACAGRRTSRRAHWTMRPLWHPCGHPQEHSPLVQRTRERRFVSVCVCVCACARVSGPVVCACLHVRIQL